VLLFSASGKGKKQEAREWCKKERGSSSAGKKKGFSLNRLHLGGRGGEKHQKIMQHRATEKEREGENNTVSVAIEEWKGTRSYLWRIERSRRGKRRGRGGGKGAR